VWVLILKKTYGLGYYILYSYGYPLGKVLILKKCISKSSDMVSLFFPNSKLLSGIGFKVEVNVVIDIFKI
jgi:hypothetical protein